LHFRYHPLGFVDARKTAPTQRLLLGHSANRLDVHPDIGGNESTVSTHATFEVDKVIRLAYGLKALFDLLALLAQTLVLLAGRFECLLGLLKTQRGFRGTTRPALWGLIARALKTCLCLLTLLLCLCERLLSSSLFGGERGTHRSAEFMLDMEQIG